MSARRLTGIVHTMLLEAHASEKVDRLLAGDADALEDAS